eukprot:GHVP01033163.1.p2 GENE.GHVP01033163.1~~GHVP01033163.1.p2  ORF type:complete len:106 (-),score=14.28 GHVP01033163.1:12-329(-)
MDGVGFVENGYFGVVAVGGCANRGSGCMLVMMGFVVIFLRSWMKLDKLLEEDLAVKEQPASKCGLGQLFDSPGDRFWKIIGLLLFLLCVEFLLSCWSVFLNCPSR